MQSTKLLLVATAASILTVATSCTEVVAPKEATTLVLSDYSLELVPSESEQLNATPKDASGTPLTRPLSWSTSAPSIATVTSGLVTGVAPGTAVIRVTADGLSSEALITVREGGLVGPAGAQISGLNGRVVIEVPSSAVTRVVKLIIRSAGALGANLRLVPGTAVELKSDASLSQAAELAIRYDSTKVAAGRAAGLRLYEWVADTWKEISGSKVDVAASTVRGSITQSGIYGVLIQIPIERISVSPKSASLKVRQQATFSAAIEDRDGAALQRRVIWSSSDVAIATIDSLTGIATGRAPGVAVILATAEGITASAPVTVAPGAAAEIAVKDGDDQSATVSTAVAIRPTVTVADQDGFPVAGARVNFSVTSGGGSVTGGSATSDANGNASVGSWTLGNVAGANALLARVEGVADASVVFSATGVPVPATPPPATPPPATPPPATPPPAPPAPVSAPPARIEIFAGDGQVSDALKPVPVLPAVKVTDVSGKAVAGAKVVFRMRSGGGSLSGDFSISDTAGIARISWTLGPAGGNSIFAELDGTAGSPLIFVATAVSDIRIVTFGDSNVDAGYAGTNPQFVAVSYISSSSLRSAASAPNHSTQLAGKIESSMQARYGIGVSAVNHGISGTRSGTGRTLLNAPNAREQVNGITRYEAEVLGIGYPWNGGEFGEPYPVGPVVRVNAFTPTSRDFAYISMGTNDFRDGLSADQSAANLTWMIDLWVARGNAPDHFILTTLAPRANSNGAMVPLNARIRAIAAARGVGLIDISSRTSDDNGLTWRSAADHVGDSIHHSEGLRDWIADQVVGYMAARIR